MANKKRKLPQEGDPAPPFVAQTQRGLVRFPEDFLGSWCVFFCHPANFTSGWRMYSDYLIQKEHWLQERNTRLLMLSNQTVCGDMWTDIISRYLSMCFKAPIIEDTDNRIADLYGMSPSRQISPPAHRLLYIIDPEGIIRYIVCRPLLSIQESLAQIAQELERLQNNITSTEPIELPPSLPFEKTEERLEQGWKEHDMRPAYLSRKKPHPN